MNDKQKKVIDAVSDGEPIPFDPYKTPGSNIIMERPPMKCDLCGVFEETRPYGPKGEEVCFACGMKDEKTTKRQMDRILFGKTAQ